MHESILAHGDSIVDLQIEATCEMRVHESIVHVVGIRDVIKGEIHRPIAVAVVIRDNELRVRAKG